VLTNTASIYDHLGLLSPDIIAFKTFIQKLWQDKLKSDALLPAHLQQEWNQLLQTIHKLSQIKLIQKDNSSNAVNIQIYGFCEISE